MLASVAVREKERQAVKPSSPGNAIAARRKWLGLTAEELVERTGGSISLSTHSQQ